MLQLLLIYLIKVIQKTDASFELIGNKIEDKIASIPKSFPQIEEKSMKNTKGKIRISKKKRQQNIDELRLI